MLSWVMPQTESTRNRHWRLRFRPLARASLAVFVSCAALLTAKLLPAAALPTPETAPAPAHAGIPAKKHVHPRKKSSSARPTAQPVHAAVPAAPKAPDWPMNDPASEASVVWDSHGLRIVASNSSLAQILKDVAAKTGATVEGMGADERIFGVYGPGSAHDVLSQLLDGSGYDVLMIGDQGEGTPRRIVLSVRSAAGTQPSGNNSQSATNDEESGAGQQDDQPPPQEGASPQARAQQQLNEQMQQRRVLRQLELEQQNNNEQNQQN